MAPKKRGRRATAQSEPKEDEKPSSVTAEEEPKEEEPEDKKPLTKKAKAGRGRSVAKPDPAEKKLSEEVKAEAILENNGSIAPVKKTREIVVEHCKQCQCFKVRASKVEKELKAAINDVEVKINPDKPRRGCFEIRDGEGNIFLSLQDMPRPFTKLKQWDLDGTISEIIEKIK